MSRSDYHFRALKPDQSAEYDQLARRYGTLFCSSQWLSTVAPDSARLLGLYDSNDRLTGGMGLCIERRYGLKVARRAPFTQHAGPFYEPRAKSHVAVLEEQDRVLDALLRFLNQMKPTVRSLSLAPQFETALPFFWAGYKIVPNLTYRIDLDASVEDIWKGVASRCRRGIRAAGRDNLDTRLTSDHQVIFDLVAGTFRRQGKKIDMTAVSRIVHDFSNNENGFCYSTFSDDRAIATCFCVHDGHSAYYILGGYDESHSHYGAGPAAFWQAIQHAKEIGLSVFDFEGSMIPKVEKYFRQFGGKRVSYLTANRAWFPVECALKAMKRNIF